MSPPERCDGCGRYVVREESVCVCGYEHWCDDCWTLPDPRAARTCRTAAAYLGVVP